MKTLTVDSGQKINYAGVYNQFKKGNMKIALTNRHLKQVLAEHGITQKDYHGSNDLREVMVFLGYKGHK